jgi:YbbR domain-containing protein
VCSVETVDIILRGDERVISRLSENDLRATVDASQLTPGDHSLPVRIANPAGTEVIDIYPKEAKITVDRVAEKQVPVTLALLGETAHGYSSFKATVKPSHIVLRGPVSILETIVEARAEVNLDSAQTNLTLNLPVKVQDKWGNFYNGNMFTLTPSTVEVFVPIVSDTPSKTVPIRVSLEGSPAVNYRVSRTIIEPETVQILYPVYKKV